MRRSVSGRQEQEKTNNPEAFWDSPGGWPFIVKVRLRSKCGEAELFGFAVLHLLAAFSGRLMAAACAASAAAARFAVIGALRRLRLKLGFVEFRLWRMLPARLFRMIEFFSRFAFRLRRIALGASAAQGGAVCHSRMSWGHPRNLQAAPCRCRTAFAWKRLCRVPPGFRPDFPRGAWSSAFRGIPRIHT